LSSLDPFEKKGKNIFFSICLRKKKRKENIMLWGRTEGKGSLISYRQGKKKGKRPILLEVWRARVFFFAEERKGK